MYQSFVLSSYPLQYIFTRIRSTHCGGAPESGWPRLVYVPRDSCPGPTSRTLIRCHQVHRVFCLYAWIKVTLIHSPTTGLEPVWVRTDRSFALTTGPQRFQYLIRYRKRRGVVVIIGYWKRRGPVVKAKDQLETVNPNWFESGRG